MEMKKEWKYFTVFNHEKEEEYLSGQHRSGWKFVKVTGIGFYHFEKCTPDDVVYQLDYNKEGLENKQEYIQMFEDFGWEYIQDYVGYSYFRKSANAMDGDEEIFCDESSRIAMMDRVYKARMIPLLIIFCTCLLPQFVLNFANGRYFLAVLMGGILAIYVVFFGYSAVHYYRKKNKVE